jgi:hypothetical protein
MIFIALRKFIYGDCTENVTCIDEDFEMALMIANVYLQHGLIMNNNLPKKKDAEVLKGLTTKNNFLKPYRKTSSVKRLLS